MDGVRYNGGKYCVCVCMTVSGRLRLEAEFNAVYGVCCMGIASRRTNGREEGITMQGKACSRYRLSLGDP